MLDFYNYNRLNIGLFMHTLHIYNKLVNQKSIYFTQSKARLIKIFIENIFIRCIYTHLDLGKN